MRVAVSSADGRGLDAQVSAHFGRCPFFTLVEINDGVIEAVDVLANPHYQDHRPGMVPSFVNGHQANMIIAGGMGRRAIAMFDQLSIEAFTGAQGTVRAALEMALEGELEVAAPCAGRGGGDCDDHGDHHP